MTYIALLRGINVGGNRKVEMKRLRAVFEGEGFTEVSTYINSGNVIFTSEESSREALVKVVEAAIEREFGFPVKVIVTDADAVASIVAALPHTWANDTDQRCDVLFLDPQVDSPAVLDALTIKPGIDDVIYTPGAVLWHVDRSNVNRSGLLRIIGTELYALITVRNCNTLHKLEALTRK